MKLRSWITALALFIFWGSACTPTQGTPAPGPSQVWIISPASGVILPPDPVNLKFEGASFVGITEFEISVDGNWQAVVPPLGSGSCGANCGTKFFGEYVWNPPGVGVYTIALRALGNGQYSPATEIEVTIAVLAAEEQDPAPIEPTPTSTPLPKVIPEKVFVVGLKNGNCREGGGNQYEIIDALLQDQSAEAVALSEDGFYIKIIGPIWKNECWIWGELVDVEQGDVKGLPVEPYPPAPDSEPAQPQPEAPRPEPTLAPAGRP